MPNVFPHHYQLDESTSNFGVVEWYFFILIQILKETSVSKPDQTPRFVASNLVLHCLPMSHKKTARLIWVNHTMKQVFFHWLLSVSET